ncbi:hypothetical protein FHR59_003571 [Xanthomonas arboricola]|uniref:hypothetical protein n=1 Tax=Xanthomonas TaxID=338 RepID=UPI00160AC1DC|nr:hypothetical protein [Xanthomonas arboricola]MBB6339281.1 hypothetical protein [Xanthomonas arboricola]
MKKNLRTFISSPLGLTTGIFFVSILFLFFHQFYIFKVHPDAVYMDSLRLLHQWYDWRSGRITFHEYWNQGSHRGFVFQAILGLNVKLFALDPLLANRLTGYLIAVSSFLVAFGALRMLLSEMRLVYRPAYVYAAIILSGAIFFSLAGFEVLTLDLGLGLWLKNFLIICFFLSASQLQKKQAASWNLLFLCILGPVIVLIFGMGWSYAFVAAFFSVQFIIWSCDCLASGKILLRRSAIVGFALIVSISGYILLGQSSAASSSTKNTMPAAGDLIGLVLAALGSSLIGAESLSFYNIPVIALTFLGAGLIGILGAILITTLARRRIVELAFPLYLSAYAIFASVSICLARGGAGITSVIASRYFMDFLLLPVALIWLVVYAIINGVSRKERFGWKILSLAYCGVIVAGLLLTNYREWRAAPYRAQAFQEMNNLLLGGDIDERNAKLLQAPLNDALKGRESLFFNKLSVFSQKIEDECKISALGYSGGWYEPESDGRWISQSAGIRLSQCSCPLIISLFLPSNFERREMKITGVLLAPSKVELSPGSSYSLELPATVRPVPVLFSLSKVTVPAELPGGSVDSRRLGVFFSKLAYSCDSQ